MALKFFTSMTLKVNAPNRSVVIIKYFVIV